MCRGEKIILKALDKFKKIPYVCKNISKVLDHLLCNTLTIIQLSKDGVVKKLVSALAENKTNPECCTSLCNTLYIGISVDDTNDNGKRALEAGALDILISIATNGTKDVQVGKAFQTLSRLLSSSDKSTEIFVEKGYVPQIISVYRKYSRNRYIAEYFSCIVEALSTKPVAYTALKENYADEILEEITRNYQDNNDIMNHASKALNNLRR